MEAKPSKCRCLALLHQVLKDGKKKFGRAGPHLKIGNNKITDIKDNLFKFLGRHVSFNMKDSEQRTTIKNAFVDYMNLVDSEYISGASKAWIYNNHVMSFMAWPFIVFDFPVTFG